MNDQIQDFSIKVTHFNCSELLNALTITDHLPILGVAQEFLTDEKKALIGLEIMQYYCERGEFIDKINSSLSEKWISLLEHSDTRIQEKTTQILYYLQKTIDFTQLMSQLIDKLLDSLVWEKQYRNRISLERLAKDLFQAPYTDQKNRVKIIEPLFQCKYYFTNSKEQYVQGLLNTFTLFLDNSLCLHRVAYIIEIIMRSSQHANKYVRIAALNFVNSLMQQTKDQEKWSLIIRSTIQNGMVDEAIEVRVQAMKIFTNYRTNDYGQFLVPLLLNCHTENLMEQSAYIAAKLFPVQEGQPPILGLITIIRDSQLQHCLIYCYEATLSRYYQLRSSGLSTLQSLVLFMKNQPNALPCKEMGRVIQNSTFFETDPTVRQTGFTLLYHLLRLHIETLIDDLPLFLQNILFHLSDVPQECKENCAKSLALIHPKINLKKHLQDKLALLKDRERLYQDFLGMEQIPEDQLEIVQKNIDSQGGKEKVINKHGSHIVWGLSLCFRYLAKTPNDQEILVFLITEISQAMKYVDMFYQQIYEALVDGLGDLKVIKRLPIKLLDETDLLKTMKAQNQDQLLNRIGQIVGPTILQGRL